MRPASAQAFISPSDINLPPTQSLDITDWIAAAE